MNNFGGISMGKKISVVLISVISAFVVMTSGYGIWRKELTIETNIEVKPDPEVIKRLELAIDEKLEEQRILEEQRLLEEERLLEEQKLLEEQEGNNKVLEETLEQNGEEDDIPDTENTEVKFEISDENKDQIVIIDPEPIQLEESESIVTQENDYTTIEEVNESGD